MELFFDTETSGFINKSLPIDHPNQAWIMELAFIFSDKDRIYTEFSTLITAENRKCHPAAQAVHGISVEDCNERGIPESDIFDLIMYFFHFADRYVAHNISFDLPFIEHYMQRNGYHGDVLNKIPCFCTMKSTTDLCKLPGKFGKYKWPKLIELHRFLFNEDFSGAHGALEDVRATRRCYYELMETL